VKKAQEGRIRETWNRKKKAIGALEGIKRIKSSSRY